jgi:hypothetical protein
MFLTSHWYRIKEAIAFAKPYNPDAFLAVGKLVDFLFNCTVDTSQNHTDRHCQAADRSLTPPN